jgi:hypothetical protein
MKRRDLVNHLIKQKCVFIREGAKHSVFFNPETKRISTVPRHQDINSFLAAKICQDLGVPNIHKK